MIQKEIINTVLDASMIEDVISDFISLKKRGVNLLGLCPFHNEKTPSFTVSPAKGIYKCFGCGVSGNASKFIMEHENISFPESIRYLGKKYNIEIPDIELTTEQKEKQSIRESLIRVNQFALNYFHQMLISNKDSFDKAGFEYLKSRGFTEESINTFHLGYCLDEYDQFIRTANTKGYNSEFLVQVGLAGNKNDKLYDKFRNRVIFPFLSISGQPIGFTGRIIDKNSEYSKYLNSIESPVFAKGDVLFGLYQAKRAIIKNDKCYLLEGNTDVVTWFQYGIENTVCSSGTALTINQIRAIRRFTKNICIVFDGDSAGIKSALKGIDLLFQEGMNVRAINLPDGHDPDSFARSNKIENIQQIIVDRESDFLHFHISLYANKLDDPQEMKEILRKICITISKIDNSIDRDVYINSCSKLLNVDKKNLIEKISPNINELRETSLFAFNHDAIKEHGSCHLANNNEMVMTEHLKGNKYFTFFTDNITLSDIDILKKASTNVLVENSFQQITDKNGIILPVVKVCTKLLENGFNVKVMPEFDLFEKAEYVSFIFYYATVAAHNQIPFDDDDEKRTINNVAELLSKCDVTTQIKKVPEIAKIFGLKQTQFDKILKPFLAKNKSHSAQIREDIVIDQARYVFEVDNLPDYVDKKFFYRFGFFPAENKDGDNIFYIFRSQENTLFKVANFFMEPLFQVYNPDPNKNKRVVKLRHSELKRVDYVEIPSAFLVGFDSFKKFLWNEGGYVFSKGKVQHHELILESIALQFPKCYELEVFGWQNEGFYAFANCIYSENEMNYMDELGLVTHKESTYYSPAVSKIHTKNRDDSDKYKNDRFFIYKKNDETTFSQWTQLMKDVYKMNDNGTWAIVFTLLASFRSIIYNIDRIFTSLFFIGPTESGKSKIAESIRAPFMYGAPLFNLNSGTDAAFFTTLERFRDVPVIYEEYNDQQISDIKFQGLKAAVYDGEGKTKRKDASTKELDISQVNCAPILLGQEAPERDDGSLFNRVIVNHVPKNDSWTDDEANLFLELKRREKDGLSNIVIEILKMRPLIEKHYRTYLRKTTTALKEDLKQSGAVYQTRILNTVSIFIAMAELWNDKCPNLQLSFSFEGFYSIARKKLITQSEALMQSNRLAVFFNTIELLLSRERGGIQMNKELKIESVNSLTIMNSRNTTEEISFEKTKVLFLQIKLIYALYKDQEKTEALKYNAMKMYMKDHAAYLGNVKSTRFDWKEEVKDSSNGGYSVSKLVSMSKNTSAIAFNYELLEADGIILEKIIDNRSMMDKIEDDFNQNSKSDNTQMTIQDTKEKPF